MLPLSLDSLDGGTAGDDADYVEKGGHHRAQISAGAAMHPAPRPAPISTAAASARFLSGLGGGLGHAPHHPSRDLHPALAPPSQPLRTSPLRYRVRAHSNLEATEYDEMLRATGAQQLALAMPPPPRPLAAKPRRQQLNAGAAEGARYASGQHALQAPPPRRTRHGLLASRTARPVGHAADATSEEEEEGEGGSSDYSKEGGDGADLGAYGDEEYDDDDDDNVGGATEPLDRTKFARGGGFSSIATGRSRLAGGGAAERAYSSDAISEGEGDDAEAGAAAEGVDADDSDDADDADARQIHQQRGGTATLSREHDLNGDDSATAVALELSLARDLIARHARQTPNRELLAQEIATAYARVRRYGGHLLRPVTSGILSRLPAWGGGGAAHDDGSGDDEHADDAGAVKADSRARRRGIPR